MEYVMKSEAKPSLCRHWMPDDALHEMSGSCWCNPVIENHDGPSTPPKDVGTTVRHRPAIKGVE